MILSVLISAVSMIAQPPALQGDITLGAHRGGRNLWPENTLLAFTECARRWPDVLLEGDAHFTKDGEIVLIHDATVNRTTNGKGAVASLTLEELQHLDAAHHFTTDGGETFPHRGTGVRIPTFREVLEAVPDHKFLIELKLGAGIAGAMVNLLRETGNLDRVALASFNPVYMNEVRELAPEVATCFDYPNAMILFTKLRSEDWDTYVAPDDLLTVSPRLEQQFKVTPEEIAKVRAKGILYQMHTLNDPEEMETYLAYGVDSILTDRPDLLEVAIQNQRKK